MTAETGTLTSRDGTNLYWRYWAGDPLLVCFHGLGCHGGWFEPLARALNARGLGIFLTDQRGNGRSEGPRGDIDHRRQWLEDAQSIVAAARERSDARLILQGSSAGAVVALAHAIERPAEVHKLVLFSPAVASKSGVVPIGTQLRLLLASLVRPRARFDYPTRYVDEALTTGNAERIPEIQNDPLYVRNATARFTMELFKLTQWVSRRAGSVGQPTLVLQGGHDLVCEEKAARRLFDRLGTPHKQWIRYEDAYHGLELEHSPRLTQIAADVDAWVRR